MTETRNIALDYLRILATLMVVMIHVSGCFIVYIPKSAGINVNFTSFFGNLSSCAVPLFFMISGALFLNKNKSLTTKSLSRKIFHLLVVMFLWNFIYAIIDNWNNLSIYELGKDTWKGHFHFWFLEYLIGVYLLIPILRGGVEYKDGRFIKWYLVVFFAFGILRSSFNAIPFYNEEIRVITNKFHVELCDFCGYFILGHFLNTTNIKTNKYVLINSFLLMALSLYFITTFFNIQLIGTLAFSLYICIEASALFLLIKNYCSKSHNSNLIIKLSNITFGVYLIHPLFFEYILPIGCFKGMSEYLLLPLYYFIITSLSFLSSFAISKTPIINKWLV